MRRLIALIIGFAAMFAFLSPVLAKAGPEEEQKVETAAAYFQEIMANPGHGIPREVLEGARGIAIIPGIVNSPAFGLGGSIGEGVMVVRHENGKWSNPFFVNLTSTNLGLQTGNETHDTVLVFETRKAVDAVLSGGRVSLGVDISIMQGPTGRAGMPNSDVFSYSSSRGIFAGLTLGGGTLLVNKRANARYYGNDRVTLGNILAENVTLVPASAGRFNCLVAYYTYVRTGAC